MRVICKIRFLFLTALQRKTFKNGFIFSFQLNFVYLEKYVLTAVDKGRLVGLLNLF